MTARALWAEALGTAALLIAVVGSGIMAETLSAGNTGVALLANAIATGAALYVLITVLGPISGAHFNPAVTLAFALRREIAPRAALAYVAVQIAAGIVGVWIAHLMFDLQVFQFSTKMRFGQGQWVAEVVATVGLLMTIFGGIKARPGAAPALVALYITGAYWFTASTSFANPAVTIARTFSDTFAGILPANAPWFILAQLVGVAVFSLTVARLFRD